MFSRLARSRLDVALPHRRSVSMTRRALSLRLEPAAVNGDLGVTRSVGSRSSLRLSGLVDRSLTFAKFSKVFRATGHQPSATGPESRPVGALGSTTKSPSSRCCGTNSTAVLVAVVFRSTSARSTTPKMWPLASAAVLGISSETPPTTSPSHGACPRRGVFMGTCPIGRGWTLSQRRGNCRTMRLGVRPSRTLPTHRRWPRHRQRPA